MVKARFLINGDQRSETKVSSSQGDHALNYLSILYSIIESTDEHNLDSAIILLNNLSNFMLDRDGQQEYRRIPQPIVYSTAIRKEAKKFLALGLQPVDAALINTSLKHSKLTQKYIYICNLSNCILKRYNRQELTTIFSKGRLYKSHSEGSDAKTAWSEHKITDSINEDTRSLSLEDLNKGLQKQHQRSQKASDTTLHL